jgi:hypothetical protein
MNIVYYTRNSYHDPTHVVDNTYRELQTYVHTNKLSARILPVNYNWIFNINQDITVLSGSDVGKGDYIFAHQDRKTHEPSVICDTYAEFLDQLFRLIDCQEL